MRPLQAHLPQSPQGAHAHQVVGRHRQHEHLVHALKVSHHDLPHAAHGLGSAKALLDELSLLLRYRVAFTLRYGFGYGRASARLVLGHMGNDVHGLARLNEFACVMAFVRAQRDGSRGIGLRLSGVVDHGFGRFALSVAIGQCDHRIGHQAVAVVAQGVAHVEQLVGGFAFAVQPCIAIRCGFMGVVAAPLTFEVAAIAVGIHTRAMICATVRIIAQSSCGPPRPG